MTSDDRESNFVWISIEIAIAITYTLMYAIQSMASGIDDELYEENKSNYSYIKNRFRCCSRFIVGKEGFYPCWENAHFISCKMGFSENISKNTDIK